jgi:transposase-like protein
MEVLIMTKCKVYIVVYKTWNDFKIMEVFDSKVMASAYIWDWDRRAEWIDDGLDIDSIYWIEKELRSE